MAKRGYLALLLGLALVGLPAAAQYAAESTSGQKRAALNHANTNHYLEFIDKDHGQWLIQVRDTAPKD